MVGTAFRYAFSINAWFGPRFKILRVSPLYPSLFLTNGQRRRMAQRAPQFRGRILPFSLRRVEFPLPPHYAVGRKVLLVQVFDRMEIPSHPLDKEFARQNYAYFWKEFFFNRVAFNLYAKQSIRMGGNAILVEDGNALTHCDRSLRKKPSDGLLKKSHVN